MMQNQTQVQRSDWIGVRSGIAACDARTQRRLVRVHRIVQNVVAQVLDSGKQRSSQRRLKCMMKLLLLHAAATRGSQACCA
jgi:hypothetical protein